MSSNKHRSLVSEPLDDNKSVIKLPGVGPIRGARLILAGFDTAIKVRIKLVELGNNKERFHNWMNNVCDANTRQSGDCFDALNASCEMYMREN